MPEREVNFRQFTRSQKDAIEAFLDEMIKIPMNALDKLKEAKGVSDVSFVKGQRKYWQHVKAAFKLAHAQNKPRKRKQRDAQGRNDQPSKDVVSSRSSVEGSPVSSEQPNTA